MAARKDQRSPEIPSAEYSFEPIPAEPSSCGRTPDTDDDLTRTCRDSRGRR